MTAPYQPVSRRPNAAGDVVITTFNVQNLFPLTADPDVAKVGLLTPQGIDTKLAKLTLAIVYELRLPHIIAVQEVGGISPLRALARRVNTAVDSVDYRAVAPATSDRRGLRLGFLWDAARVQALSLGQLAGTAVSNAFGADCANPGREPLLGVFQVQGQQIAVINNHFKSNYVPEAQSAFAEKLRVANAELRLAQAAAVRAYAEWRQATFADEWLLVTGDFNDGSLSPGSPLAYLTAGEPPLTNLLLAQPHDEPPYTLVWDEAAQLLDHMLADPQMARACTAVNVLHFNADYSTDLQDDATTACRSSDHDALEAHFVV